MTTRSRTTHRFALPGALLALLLAGPALAAPEMTLDMVAEKAVVEEREGRREVRLVPADEAESGEVIRYTLRYRNRGDEPAAGAAFVNPVPDSTAYVGGSATGAGAEIDFSADGGQSYGRAPLLRRVRLPDGREEQREIPPEEYTHVRWRLPEAVLPSAGGELSFEVRVR